jgi:hypothetical protein
MSPLPIRKPVTLAVAALWLAAGGTAFAATATADPPPAPGMPGMPDSKALARQAKDLARQQLDLAALDDDLSGMPGFIAHEFGHPREIVKNAPYSAEAVTEFVQVLPDGNRIVRKSSTLLARDTAGRTRQERKDGMHAGVFIYDPMEGRSYVLNEGSRTATRMPRVSPMTPEPPAPPAGTPPPPPPRGSDAGSRDIDVQPGRVVVRRRSDGDGSDEDVHLEVIRIGRGDRGDRDTAVAPMPPMPPLTLPIMPHGKGETKSLGTRDFDGIKAEGTMTTHTIPAGQIGNEKPIAITSERWFSPELFVVVYAKTSDPRAGDTIYRLTNVKRGEPPADLFKVPADYRQRGDRR